MMLQYEGKVRIPSGCAISGMINKKGQLFPGNDIVKSIALMHERSNGLGGGFAAYGIYPEYKDLYAIHMFYDHNGAKETVELFLNRHFNIKLSEKIPTRKVSSIKDAPIIWRYFALPREDKLIESGLDENEFVVRCVMQINANFEGAFVVSSGKNMGAFKAVGFPEDVGDFYMLDTYKAYIWTAHGRFPTNTPAGGEVPILSRCLTGRLFTTARSLLMMQTRDGLKCTATNALFRPIQKSSPTCLIFYTESTGYRWKLL